MQKGFTIFFAMLVGGLSLTIGAAIYDLTVRELDLSQTAIQSQYAIYAADTGVECALFWDTKYEGGSAFATSSASTPLSTVECNGVSISSAPDASDASSATTDFTLTVVAAPQTYCASVRVAKEVDAGGVVYTTVTSRGYNTLCPPEVPQITRLERALQVSY